MFRKRVEPELAESELDRVVREHMRDADDETRAIVVAVARLLAQVAFVDRELSPAETAHMEEALARVEALTPSGVAAIVALVRTGGARIAAADVHKHTRLLRERTEPELRREVLEVLVDLAAADGTLDMSEADLLRRTTTALGLSPDDYVAAQARHRDRLSLLK